MKIHALTIIAALAFPTIAVAGPAKLGSDDMKIVAHLHHVNQMEIDLGKLAQKTGSSAAVRSFGDTLVKDHTQADKDLVKFSVQHKNISIPSDKPETDADKQADKDMTAQVAELKKLKGADFDKQFISIMVAGHDTELGKLEVAIAAAKDPDLAPFLRDDVKPVLQRHDDTARELQKTEPQASN